MVLVLFVVADHLASVVAQGDHVDVLVLGAAGTFVDGVVLRAFHEPLEDALHELAGIG